MHSLTTLKELEQKNEEARRIMSEHLKRQEDNERACTNLDDQAPEE